MYCFSYFKATVKPNITDFNSKYGNHDINKDPIFYKKITSGQTKKQLTLKLKYFLSYKITIKTLK